MKRFVGSRSLALILVLLLGSIAWAAPAPAAPKAPGLGDPGKLVTLEMMGGGAATSLLRGADDRLQLVVSGKYDSGQYRDFTRKAKYEVAPANIAAVDETGLVTPLANGKATITARTPEGVAGQIVVEVSHIGNEIPVNFPNEITPVFTKLGCNSGGCHGKASGQNGFKLSLLGFEPREDYEYLVKEARGRRLFPASPERSLLLLKATNMLPHGGGARLAVDSHEYRALRRWIQQGMPYGTDKDPTVTKIEVQPRTRSMIRGGEQQFRVTAHYSDGSTRDVTRVAQFDANDTEMAEVTPTGLVKTLDLTGDVAIMARYQGHVDVFRASIPLGIKVENLPASKNFVDDAVFAKLKVLGIPPSAV